MAAPLRLLERLAHQVAADAAALPIRRHERPEQQPGPAGTGGDVPEPHRADQPIVHAGDKRQALFRQPVLAQALGGLAKAAFGERLIEQRLAPCDIEPGLLTNCDHGGAFPRPDALTMDFGLGAGVAGSQSSIRGIRGQMW